MSKYRVAVIVDKFELGGIAAIRSTKNQKFQLATRSSFLSQPKNDLEYFIEGAGSSISADSSSSWNFWRRKDGERRRQNCCFE